MSQLKGAGKGKKSCLSDAGPTDQHRIILGAPLQDLDAATESDQPVTQTARKLGLRVNQIYKWRKELEEKQEGAFSGKRGRPQSNKDKDAEIRRLKKGLGRQPGRE